MTHSERLVARRHAVVPRGVGQFAGDTTVASAQGCHLVDADGHEMLDFAGGIGVVNAGHCPERVVRAIQEQAATLLHTCFHVATYEPYVALCEKLVSILPHGETTKAMLLNSGAEAVENAVKIARQATGRPAIICYSEAFHGRTMMGMSLTSKTGYKVNCGPFAPEVYRLPFPNYYRWGEGLSLGRFVERELDRLRDAFLTLISGERVAAVIIEPVQGEGGFVPAPEAYMKGLRQICDENASLLIADEVQSGFGRTGRWAAYEHSGVVPDISTWAKSLGSGLPIAAVIGKAEVMDKARPGTLGGTYGGNPVACAAALATIEVMEELNLNERAAAIGSKVRDRFLALKQKCRVVGDVRGLGAMIGMELSLDGDPLKPATAIAVDALGRCRERGVLVLPAGPYGNIIRTLSPLVVDDTDLERGISAIEDSILEAAQEAQAA